MVEVSVSNHNGADSIFTFLEVFGIRQDIVDTGSLVVGKFNADVRHNNIFAELYHCHVSADLFHPAERDYSDTVSESRNNVVGLSND